MKTFALTCCLLFSTLVVVQAQDPFSVTIHFSETGTNDADSIKGGFATSATVCLDDEYDEDEVPLLPPEGLFPVFRLDCVDDITDLRIMSQTDMRPWPVAGTDSVVQDIHIQREFGQTITLSWEDTEIPMHVDSIVVSDPFAIYVARVDIGGELEIDNEFVRDMTLTWYFDLGDVSVSEIAHESVQAFPNPVVQGSQIHFGSDVAFASIAVYDSQGRLQGIQTNTSVYTCPSTPGVYIAYLKQGNGEVATSTFVVR